MRRTNREREEISPGPTCGPALPLTCFPCTPLAPYSRASTEGERERERERDRERERATHATPRAWPEPLCATLGSGPPACLATRSLNLSHQPTPFHPFAAKAGAGAGGEKRGYLGLPLLPRGLELLLQLPLAGGGGPQRLFEPLDCVSVLVRLVLRVRGGVGVARVKKGDGMRGWIHVKGASGEAGSCGMRRGRGGGREGQGGVAREKREGR